MTVSSGTTNSTVMSCVLVADVQAELEFVHAVFGVTALPLRRGDEGELWRARVRIGDSILLIGEDSSAEPHGGATYVMTGDLQATVERAVGAGAVLTVVENETAAGRREASFRDPQGHTWWIGETRPRPTDAEVARLLRDQRKTRL